MKKIKLFAVAIAALLCGSAMAQDVVTAGAYSTRTISKDGLTSTWNFIGAVAAETKINGEMVHDNGLIFNAGAKDKLKVKTDMLSCQNASSIYFNVPKDAEGIITFYPVSTSDSRWFQLFINGTEGTTQQRLWSKEGDDLTKKGPRSYTFTSADLTQVEDSFYLHFKDNSTELKAGSFTIVLTDGNYFGTPVTYPYVKSFTMGEVEAVVDTAAKTIVAELPYGTDRATAIAGATVVMGGTAKTFSIAGDVLTAIDSVDTGKNIEYSLTGITVSEQRSDDATLKALSVNGVEVTLEEGVYTYAINVPYTTEALVPAYEVNDNTASAKHDVTGNVVTVTVTAQAENTQDYVVNVTIDPAVNKLKQAKFTNGYYAFQKDGEEAIHAYYLEGAAVPTIDEASIVYDGASMIVDGNTVKVTGADSQVKDYVITLEAVTPGAFTTEEIALDSAAFKAGTFPAWVIAPYGIANKSGKEGAAFSKTDSDYSREWAGKTHIEMFMPACDTVYLFEPDNSARDFKVFVNGVELSTPTSLAKNTWTPIVVEQSEPFMLTIQSNQTKGDGLINKIRMAKKSTDPTTALSNAAIKVKAQKFMRNGAVYFHHNAKVFNMMGQEIRF